MTLKEWIAEQRELAEGDWPVTVEFVGNSVKKTMSTEGHYKSVEVAKAHRLALDMLEVAVEALEKVPCYDEVVGDEKGSLRCPEIEAHNALARLEGMVKP